jgi:glycosyltransferase involved in cell wall biosynthesis
MMKISVVIPTYNEAQAIAEVIGAVPQNKTQEIIVVDNGSTDGTAEQAAAAGARVIHEPRKGYGSACCSGANAAGNSDIIVFLDGDRSDDPAQLELIAAPVIKGQADLVIGSRIGGRLEKGSMPLHAKLRRPHNGHRFVSGDSNPGVSGFAHGTDDLWLAGGNGCKGGAKRIAHSKCAHQIPQKNRDFQSDGLLARQRSGSVLYVFRAAKVPF